MSYHIRLPWPPVALHPNGRPHRLEKAAATKKARWAGKIAALEAGARNLGWPGLYATVVFCPPNRTPRDLDGALSACKALFDGIADATGIDDSLWTFGRPVMGEPVKGGCVIVEIARP